MEGKVQLFEWKSWYPPLIWRTKCVPYTINTKSFKPVIIDFFTLMYGFVEVYTFRKLRLWERRTALLQSYVTNVISYFLTSVHNQIFGYIWNMIVMCMVYIWHQRMGSLETRQGRWTIIKSLRMSVHSGALVSQNVSSLWSAATGRESKKLVHKQF